jgi:hypothetical protein
VLRDVRRDGIGHEVLHRAAAQLPAHHAVHTGQPAPAQHTQGRVGRRRRCRKARDSSIPAYSTAGQQGHHHRRRRAQGGGGGGGGGGRVVVPGALIPTHVELMLFSTAGCTTSMFDACWSRIGWPLITCPTTMAATAAAASQSPRRHACVSALPAKAGAARRCGCGTQQSWQRQACPHRCRGEPAPRAQLSLCVCAAALLPRTASKSVPSLSKHTTPLSCACMSRRAVHTGVEPHRVRPPRASARQTGPSGS